VQALIIAAGRGSRMRQRFSPKPLITIFGLRLIERIILRAKSAGIKDFKIVVGYKAKKIIETIGNGEKYGVHIEYIYNHEWEKGNGVSVYKAKDFLDNQFLLLMSDHLFDDSILKKLKEVKLKNNHCVLCVDRNLKGERFNLEDVTKVWMDNNKVKTIGKEIGKFNAVDTGIFMCTHAIFDALEKSIAKGDYSLSAGNQILSDEGKLETLDITGYFWVDVDDEAALKKAKYVLLQHLNKSTDGPISRNLNRKLSIRISSRLTKYAITPNQLTLFSFALALLSALFFYLGKHYSMIVLGGVMAQLSSIFDGCDGEIARLKFASSRFGQWLDRILDRYADGFILLGMTHAAWLSLSAKFVWVIGFTALIGSFMNSYTAIQYDELLSKKLLSARGLRVGRDARLFIVFMGALFNQLLPALLLLAILTNFESLRRVWVLRYAYQSSRGN